MWSVSVPSDLKLKRFSDTDAAPVSFTFEDHIIEAFATDSVAAAVLAAGERVTRTTPVSGSGRGPFCMMGVCFECLMEIDGMPNSQACMVSVKPGMVVRRMQGARHIQHTDTADEPADA
jgi:succinate dehydrogenase/fumarate reductase-like Fe-S protein